MLSRRNFVRALAAGALTLAGGAAFWRLWQGWNRRYSDLPPAMLGKDPRCSFFLLSDLHVSGSDSAMSGRLRTALTDITKLGLPVDGLVLGGDLVDGGRESDYQELSEILSGYKLPPFFANMGNHEYYDIWYNARGDWSKETVPNNKTDAQARERFMRFMKQKKPYRDVWLNGVHLILLSQESYVQERPEVGEGAWYSDQQLAWLAEVMKPHADGRPAFIFIHQSVPAEGQDGGTHRLIRNKEFRAILKPYRNLFVFSGHTHRNLEMEGRYVKDSTFHWFSNASVGKTRAGNSVANASQGLYVQVQGGQVVVLGREFSNRSWIRVAQWQIPLV